MTEAAARERYGHAVQIYQREFQPLFYSLAHSTQTSLIKLVVEAGTDRVLGIHMVGDHAAEVVQSLTVAMQHGVTKRDLDHVIGIHPSSAEEFFDLD